MLIPHSISESPLTEIASVDCMMQILSEALLVRTHNVCFCEDIRKIFGTFWLEK